VNEHERIHWQSVRLLLTVPLCYLSKSYLERWNVRWYETWKRLDELEAKPTGEGENDD
jgi:hypothetical protein